MGKRDAKGVDAAARDGAYVTGMFLEGARWDLNSNCLEESKPKEMFFRMPVINCRAGMVTDREEKNVYICPTYCVTTRRPHFVFPAQLRTKHPAAKGSWRCCYHIGRRRCSLRFHCLKACCPQSLH